MRISLYKPKAINNTQMVIGSKKIAEMLGCEQRLDTKVKLCEEKGMVYEMFDWHTYLEPGTPGFIEGELLHALVSGNGHDYTADELLPAVNTMIGKPVYKVPNSKLGMQSVKKPDNLHADPDKEVVGFVSLVRMKGGAINFLAEVDMQTWDETRQGIWPRGSVEANFMVAAPSSKASAAFKPEFITFTGYLLLPDWAEPGDRRTVNRVFETVRKDWNCECPSKMTSTSKI